MQVTKINTNNYNTSFNARFKIDPALTEKIVDNVYGPSTVSSLTGGASSVTGAASGSLSTALGSDVLGTAFSLKASGINSSGIVPSYLKSAAESSSMPAFLINGSQAHPSTAGSIFSTLGSWLHSAKNIVRIKDPS